MIDSITVQKDFEITTLANRSEEALLLRKAVNQDTLQLHFCIRGTGTLQYGPHYSRSVMAEQSLL